ncbi:MAG: hypothetical protein JRF30_05230 [Deltaproteobacteria bacterium]|nr:hypothetical protein [Deltaproteobacteria bacterium]MBW2330324.1 hypothetical protein [Deltaproteobacteria bacterium]
MKALAFDLRKESIFDRRTSRVRARRGGRIDGHSVEQSSTDVVYKITKAIDPQLKGTLEIHKDAYLKKKR